MPTIPGMAFRLPPPWFFCFFLPVHLRSLTFIQHRTEDRQAVIDGGAIPPPAPELVLAFLDADLHPFCHAGHDLHIIPTEAQLLGHQARDAATENGLRAQRGILVADS